MTCRLSFDDSELRHGRMSATHLDQALEAMRRDGFVVLEQAVDHEPLDILKQRMDRDSRELLAFCETIGGNPRETGHLQQGPPPFAPYVFSQIVVHPFVTQLSHAVLGPYAFNNFYNGNTNAPGSGFQQVHLDNPHVPAGTSIAHATYSLVVNIVRTNRTEPWSSGPARIACSPRLPFPTSSWKADVAKFRRSRAVFARVIC